MTKNSCEIIPIYLPYHIDTCESNILFLDIVTSGLYWRNSHLLSLGIIYQSDDRWIELQWNGTSEEDEYEILCGFISIAKPFHCCVTYNGIRFDLPYLEAKLKAYGLEDPFLEMSYVDLYRMLKPCQTMLKLPSMKLADLSQFLSLPALNDTQALFAISSMYAYTDLLSGDFSVTDCEQEEDALFYTLTLAHPLPKVFSYGKSMFYLTGRDAVVKLKVPVIDGMLRKYYADYKDYYYLPAEDCAVHKSVASYVEKPFRKKATADTCYTRFPLTDSFMLDTKKTAQYIREILTYLLS